PPRIFGHKSALDNGNFVTLDYILNKDQDDFTLMHRFCPHRRFPIDAPGKVVNELTCKFHGFKWDSKGNPINNDKKLSCGKISCGESNLVFKNFEEPSHSWVKDLKEESNLKYSHSYFGKSQGSWLWFMDVNTDLLHVYKQGIHPFLSQQIDLEDIKMEHGSNWILQSHPEGWWCCIFPFTFIEYGRPGKLGINTVVPNNLNNEFGFQWMTQIYYDDRTTPNEKLIFETLEEVFKEDIGAAELQQGPYFPLHCASNRYEDHCVIWGDWVKNNRI
ncbi:MAG: hypothetical protein EBV10_12220, partial [Synechococcaceae bacterium WB6_1A_059]|nr:hypothetical protein [Synechococcaceae bacterium WB6_1A_059]